MKFIGDQLVVEKDDILTAELLTDKNERLNRSSDVFGRPTNTDQIWENVNNAHGSLVSTRCIYRICDTGSVRFKVLSVETSDPKRGHQTFKAMLL